MIIIVTVRAIAGLGPSIACRKLEPSFLVGETYNGLHYILNKCEIFCSEQLYITFGDRWGTLLLIELFGFLFFITVFVSSFSPSFHFFFIFCRHLRFDFFIVRQISSLAQQESSCHSKMMMVFDLYLSCSCASRILVMSNKL